MNAYLKAEGFDTLHILHNNSYSVEGYAICGTRGWLFDVGEPHDEKVMNREIGRLRMSLQAAEPGLEKLVFLHYPPVYTGTSAPEIVATLKEYGIKTCFYGHLHGNAIRFAVQGEVDGIRYKLVSADGLRYCPYRINLRRYKRAKTTKFKNLVWQLCPERAIISFDAIVAPN